MTKNAGGDPVLEVSEWRLRIDGEVGRPVEAGLRQPARLPAVEVTKTLECISNFVAKCELAPFGCDLISTARWRGVRVSDVLALAGGPARGRLPGHLRRGRVHHVPAHGGWPWPRRRCWCTR